MFLPILRHELARLIGQVPQRRSHGRAAVEENATRLSGVLYRRDDRSDVDHDRGETAALAVHSGRMAEARELSVPTPAGVPRTEGVTLRAVRQQGVLPTRRHRPQVRDDGYGGPPAGPDWS